MATTYTDAESNHGTVHTTSDSNKGTKPIIEEPRGFGHSPFGDPSSVDKEYRTKGFGDPLTKHTTYNND